LPIPSHQQANTRLTAIPPCQHRARREPWSGDPGRAPEARAFNQARPLREIWWLVTELNRGPWYARFSRTGVACTVSTGFSDQHSTVEFTSPILLFAQDFACRLPLSPCLAHACKAAQLGGRCETRTRISRVQAVGNPLIRTAQPGEPTRAPNQREQLARAQQLGCGAL